MSFICHIHNYTEYNQQWNVFSAFNPSKCTHTWSSGCRHCGAGEQLGVRCLAQGLTSVVDNSCRSRDSNPLPRVTSLTLYPLGHDWPLYIIVYNDVVMKIHSIAGNTHIKKHIYQQLAKVWQPVQRGSLQCCQLFPQSHFWLWHWLF